MSAAIILHQWEISPFCRKVARALRPPPSHGGGHRFNRKFARALPQKGPRFAAVDCNEEFLRHLDRIETALDGGEWMVGATKTIAGIAVGSQLLEIQRTSAAMRPELQKRPRLSRWLTRI